MFQVNEDNSIYVTRGDMVFLKVTARSDANTYIFKAGEVLRIKIYGKKNCENLVLQKDFPVTSDSNSVDIVLEEAETKIGGIINKPTDYWYEVELNPFDFPQTIIGYNEDGPALFRLFPEGRDIDGEDLTPEDLPFVDDELDMSSTRPVQNQVISRAFAELEGKVNEIRDLYITPKSYGAVGDGITDDTTAIQMAINAAMKTGGAVYFPEGVYVITDTIKISTLANKEWEEVKNVHIRGAGSSRTVFKAKITSKPAFLYENVNNGNFSNSVAESFSIIPFSDDYNYKFDGIKLINAVGNIYRDIIVSLANIGVLLTTNKNTSISEKNTGYTEQNVFEDVRISAVKGVVFNAGDNSLRASFHGNVFERVSITANSNNTGVKTVAISLESGYIYNCTFNIKTFQSGANSHLLYINTPCGINTGTISFEDFTGDGVKISTGNLATAHFMLDGHIYGLGSIDWSEYRQCAVGDVDESGNAINAANTNIGRERISCRNLIPPCDLSSITQDKKSYMSMPLYGGKEDDWSGDAHNLIRYRNTDGNTEHGYLMACKQSEYGRSRFILGTIHENARSLDDFVPGFYVFADGTKIVSAKNGAELAFREDGIAVNGSLVRRANEERYIYGYNSSMKLAGGLKIIWGAFEAPIGVNTQIIDLSEYGLSAAFNVQATPFSVTSDGHKNYASVSALTNNGFKIHTDNTSKGLVYWVVFGHSEE